MDPSEPVDGAGRESSPPILLKEISDGSIMRRSVYRTVDQLVAELWRWPECASQEVALACNLW
jgi:hypothetical protein